MANYVKDVKEGERPRPKSERPNAPPVQNVNPTSDKEE